MKIFLALIAGLIAGSDGQNFLRTDNNNDKNCAPVSTPQQDKQSFVCKKAVEIASEHQYYAQEMSKNLVTTQVPKKREFGL